VSRDTGPSCASVRAGGAARPLLVGYLAFLVLVVLWPSSAVQAGVIERASQVLLELGLPYRLVGFDRLEVVANVVMVVPAGALAVWAWRRPTWQAWTAYGFLGSLAVELTQGLVLPDRQASGTDVVANTLGMLLGAVLGAITRPRR
jgi:glycopeptide antibiotics resistance protein